MSLPYRILEKFESADATRGVWFPRSRYEWSADQAFGAPLAISPGAGYAYDQLEGAAGIKQLAREDVRFEFVDNGFDGLTWAELSALWTSYDWTSMGLWGASVEDAAALLRRELAHIGRGKLWTLGRDGSRRWCWARAGQMPRLELRAGRAFVVPAVVSFARYSDWFGEDLESGSASIAAASTAVTITNAGDAPVRDAVLTLAGTFTNPTITNTTTGESVATTRDGASASDVLRIDAGRYAVERSANGGVSYSDDYDLVTLGTTQVALVTLQPGDNEFTVASGGTPSATFAWSFYPAYH